MVVDGVRELAERCFQCMDIEKVSIPTTVKKIGPLSFMNCSRLKCASLPEGLTIISIYCFAESDVAEVSIPKSVEHIQ